MGLRVRLGRHVTARAGYLAGNDAERASDLMDMFRDPEVRAVFCVRGGYGSSRLLRLIDFDIIRSNPKIFVGFSDITSLLLAFHRLAGLVTFHGPMLASDLAAGVTDFSEEWLHRALFAPFPLGKVRNPPGDPPPVTIRGGRVSGSLVGGNLSLVAASLGTACQPEWRGRILFLEEVGESPYRIDRMLTHLRNAGVFDAVAGILVGECVGCSSAPGETVSGRETVTVEKVLRDVLGGLGVPVLYGLPIGHGRHRATLPLGVRAVLDATAGFLDIVEAATLPGRPPT